MVDRKDSLQNCIFKLRRIITVLYRDILYVCVCVCVCVCSCSPTTVVTGNCHLNSSVTPVDDCTHVHVHT